MDTAQIETFTQTDIIQNLLEKLKAFCFFPDVALKICGNIQNTWKTAITRTSPKVNSSPMLCPRIYRESITMNTCGCAGIHNPCLMRKKPCA